MKKILILFNEDRNINTYPYITNMIEMINSDYEIDFLVNNSMYSEHNIKNLNLILASNSDYVSSAINYLQNYGDNYTLLMSYSIDGIWAFFYYVIFNFHKNIKCVYFSMELYDIDRKPPHYILNLWNKFSFKLKSKILFSVVQDRHRAKILKDGFNFIEEIYLIPNGYVGFTNEKDDFAYTKFGIDRNKKILLFTGGIEKSVFDIDLPKYINQLYDKNFVLILSGFSRDKYIETIKKNI